MCEYLDNTPPKNKNRNKVEKMLKALLQGVIDCQGENGLWHQVLNRSETYEETSCTAMFLYALSRSTKFGIFTKGELKGTVDRAFNGLCEKSIDADGNIFGVCMGSGCSKDWRDYATLGTIKNDDHGTGITLAALCAYADCFVEKE